jgi:hypothetical protein
MPDMFRKTYLQNVKEYFEKKKIINTSSVFETATYDLYKMILNNRPVNEIDEQIKYINTLPVSYFEMRSMFG